MGIIYEARKKAVECYESKSMSRLQYPAHFHYTMELVRMKKGNTSCYIDTKKYNISDGDLFVAFPNQIHYYESTGPESYIIYFVSPKAVPCFTELMEKNVPENAVVKADKITPLMNLLLDEIFKFSEVLKKGEKYSNEIMQGLLEAFFGELLRQMDLYSPDTAETSAIKSIVDYCSKNYSKELSLDVLSSELHMSKYYISHIFSNKLNVKFNDYINSIRISTACMLLSEGKMTITQASEAVGFSTIRTFNRAFLKLIGKSPTDYRKSLQDSDNLFLSSSPMLNSVIKSMKKEMSKRS